MKIVLAGLSHHAAPVELRERLALPGDALRHAPGALPVARDLSEPGHDMPSGQAALREAVVISTCNRLEAYAVGTSPHAARTSIEQALCGFQALEREEIAPHLYVKEDAAAARHLMR